MKTVAIIQARMGSSRLPGKVLEEIHGQPMIERVLTRLSQARTLDSIVLATTIEPQDDPVAEYCRSHGWNCFRGDHLDVLDRYYKAACEHHADVVVRITADCPLIDPGVIDRVVGEFEQQQPEIDYAANVLTPRTFPRGLDTEVFRFQSLERAWRDAADPACREHVTMYFYRNPDLFRLHGIVNETDESRWRWTVDTTEDLQLVRTIYSYFGERGFSWQDVLRVCAEHPEWSAINSHIQQKVA
jgi:spore coat polysaccharide biosynthesis protein SpsF